MPAALSTDLRTRVVAALEEGLSCAQVAERFGVSAASASRWRAKVAQTGSPAPQPMGGDRRSARLEAHASSFLLDQVAQTPDLTLAELQAKLRRRGVKAALGTIWRLLARHTLTYKKRRMPRSSSART